MGVPAYGLFVLFVRPQILRRWRTMLLLVGCLLLGLTPLLYYPLRSPSAPFGPTDMRTWEGFTGHITARDLRVNLFHFGVPDQADRALVFWSLLRLQFPLLVLALIIVGLLWLALRGPKPGFLLVAFVLSHLLFTLNTVQDVMAYLLIPFAGLSIVAGAGALALSMFLLHCLSAYRVAVVNGLLAVGLMVWPLLQGAVHLARGISLRNFSGAEEFVAATYGRFAGRGEGAVLVSDWEHLTPLWVHMYTQAEPLKPQDLKLVYVSTATPWVESVWANIEAGPIYLPDYRPAVRDGGFRLIPDSGFYAVVPPPVVGVAPTVPLDVVADGRVHILGYDLSTENVQAGEAVAMTLYQSVSDPMEGIWMPYAQLGPVEARWTTDSRLLTSQWLPGEVVVERYEVRVPFGMQPGSYPLRLGYADLTGGRATLELSSGETLIDLASITVLPNPKAPPPRVLEHTLANLDNQVALVRARGRAGWQVQSGVWKDSLVVRPGGVLHLTLNWRALASPRESYTIFIHLIDGAGRPVTGHDYTPLGGACPTFLWFPKWLPGQTFVDPYRLAIPDSLSPGDYWLEVGMYGMTSLRRLPVVDLSGSLAGDRVILGPVRVE
jgi:hypothetical protein